MKPSEHTEIPTELLELFATGDISYKRFHRADFTQYYAPTIGSRVVSMGDNWQHDNPADAMKEAAAYQEHAKNALMRRRDHETE